jgi:hypothetical protein
MAGSTTNETILAGVNQIIAAINALELSSTCPTPEISVTVRPNITVNCSCSGGGTKQEDPPVSATDPPPAGSEPDPAIATRECKASNVVFDHIRRTVYLLDMYNVDEMSTAGIVAAGALVVGLMGSQAPLLGNVLGAIVGAIAGLIFALWGGNINLGDMLTILDTNKDDLVCALYEQATSATGSTQTAKDNFLAICNTGGMSTQEYYLTSLMMPHDFLKMLFQAVLNSEEILAAYSLEGKSDCVCGSPASWALWYGIGTVNYSTPFTLSSVQLSNFYLVCMSGELRNCTFSNLSGWNGLSVNDFIAGTGGYGIAPENDVWNSDTPFTSMCCGVWSITSTSPFSVSVRIGSEC